MKVVIFDLDDTLYDEYEFVKSGFKVVAAYLSSRYELDKNDIFTRLCEITKRDGRGKVFNTLLSNLGLYSLERVQTLIYIYRSHLPKIFLEKRVVYYLNTLRKKGLLLGIVTDGKSSVQSRKVEALGLKDYFDLILCSDELGREYWKPSTVPFKVVLDLLKTPPEKAVYVGDNVRKDFYGPNLMGLLTIQLRKWLKRENDQNDQPHSFLSTDFHAKYVVEELEEINTIIGV